MATTIYGQVNALEAEVASVMSVAMEMLDSMVIETPLAFAQDLYDYDGADRMVILLDREADLITARADLQGKITAKKLPLEVKLWSEVDKTTEKVENMLHVIFVFLFTIFVIISLMSVVNTIGLAVSERTREIGTLRALGVRRRGIVAMFACESMLLGLLGAAVGVFLTLLGWAIVRIVDPHWTPPAIPMSIPLEIHLTPGYMAVTLVVLGLFSLMVAIFPARRAARSSIVDSLGHI
jgi:putative ABC transport system permease protein